MNKYIKQLTESLFDDIDDIFSDEDEDMEILSSLEDVYLPYVDLGLPSGTLWYKCNLGAKHEYEPGLYFQWGDTEGYKDAISKKFNLNTYKLFKEYKNNDEIYFKYDFNLTKLELEDDAAYVMSKGLAIIPSYIQFKELWNECDWKYTESNNVNGYLVTGPNNNSIFLPIAGYYDEDKLEQNYGAYWSSNLTDSDYGFATILTLHKSGSCPWVNFPRFKGIPIRSVVRKNKLNDK